MTKKQKDILGIAIIVILSTPMLAALVLVTVLQSAGCGTGNPCDLFGVTFGG